MRMNLKRVFMLAHKEWREIIRDRLFFPGLYRPCPSHDPVRLWNFLFPVA